jgi:asparagine synthase (glutamine-hydrolysing)
MKGILPKSVAKRRSKLGFATPEKDWMQSTHYEHFNTYFAEMKNPFLNGTRISEAFSSGSKKLDYKSLLRIYLFDRWYQFHFNHSNLE